jgi:prevent-host-death family protein
VKSVGIREAKPRLSALVRAAAEGETILITDYGKPVALIAPLEKERIDGGGPDPEKSTEIDARAPTDAAAFLEALLDAPFELNLDF